MARAPREREVEQDSRTERPARPADTVMVGGMDHLVGNADDEVDIEIEPEKEKPKRVVADVERTDREERSRRDEDEEDSRLAYDLTGGDDIEERQSRRTRRNRARREALAGRDQYIAALTQRLDQLNGVVQSLTQGQVGLTLNSVDTQLNAAQQALALADEELARAVAASDGAKFRDVQRLRDEAAARVFQLSNTKNGLTADARRAQQQPAGRSPGPQPAPAGVGLNARAQEFSEIFMNRYPYFDPQGTDEETMVMRAIDDAVMAEGYRPDTKLYWTTLEERLKARGFMPGGGDRDDDVEDRRPPPRRAANGNRNAYGGLPPSSGGSSSPRRRNGSESYTLPPMAREYLESEGLLEPNLNEQQLAKRNRLIREWRTNEQRARRGEYART